MSEQELHTAKDRNGFHRQLPDEQLAVTCCVTVCKVFERPNEIADCIEKSV
jgi:hypothetical protein